MAGFKSFAAMSLGMVLFTILINLALLAGAVAVVVWVLKAMGVIQ